MTLIALGLVFWTLAHMWKRISPGSRDRFGERGKALVAIASVVAIMLMIVGYRGADTTVFWGRATWSVGINNILMVVSIYLFAASGAKTKITRTVRHPQLSAVIVWAVAHLLVNGDTASFLLFGGLLVWAVAEILIINRAEGPRAPYHAVPVRKEITAAVATVVVFIIVGAIHALLGYNPFG